MTAVTAWRRIACALLAGIFFSQANATDDFASLFNDDFKGVSLSLARSDEQLAARPSAFDLDAISLRGSPLSDEELGLILRVTDPVGHSALKAAPAPENSSIRQRFLSWLSPGDRAADDTGAVSMLVREEKSPGIRVDVDTDSEEVVVEYRFGF